MSVLASSYALDHRKLTAPSELVGENDFIDTLVDTDVFIDTFEDNGEVDTLLIDPNGAPEVRDPVIPLFQY